MFKTLLCIAIIPLITVDTEAIALQNKYVEALLDTDESDATSDEDDDSNSDLDDNPISDLDVQTMMSTQWLKKNLTIR